MGGGRARWLTEPSSSPDHGDRPRMPTTSRCAPFDASTSDAAGSPSATSVSSGTGGVFTIRLTFSMMNSLLACSSSSRSKAPGNERNGTCQAKRR